MTVAFHPSILMLMIMPIAYIISFLPDIMGRYLRTFEGNHADSVNPYVSNKYVMKK